MSENVKFVLFPAYHYNELSTTAQRRAVVDDEKSRKEYYTGNYIRKEISDTLFLSIGVTLHDVTWNVDYNNLEGFVILGEWCCRPRVTIFENDARLSNIAKELTVLWDSYPLKFTVDLRGSIQGKQLAFLVCRDAVPEEFQSRIDKAIEELRDWVLEKIKEDFNSYTSEDIVIQTFIEEGSLFLEDGTFVQ